MLTALALSLACAPSAELGGQPPDFSLVDVNTASTSYMQTVSPRDMLDRASAWYFGHST